MSISIKTEVQIELALVGTHQISSQIIFQNEWLRSLLSHIPKIWQHPPWPTTTTSTSGAPHSIMVRLHGDFTGRIPTRSGKIKVEEAICSFSNPSTNTVIYCSCLITISEEYTEEEQKCGDDSRSNYFISLSSFELLKWLLKISWSPLMLYWHNKILKI